MPALAVALQKRFKIVVTFIGADLETSHGAAKLHADIKARGIVQSALVNLSAIGIGAWLWMNGHRMKSMPYPFVAIALMQIVVGGPV